MSLITRLWPFGSRKESEAYSMLAHHQQGRAVMTPIEYEKLAKEGYHKNAVAYACVNKISTSVKTVKFLLYKKTSAGLVEVERHPVLDLLARPNPLMSGPKYWEHIAAYIQLAGNSYVHAPGAEKGKAPRELWPLLPNTVTVIPGQFAMPQSYRVTAGGSTRDFPVDQLGAPGQMLHVKTFNPVDPWYGMSPIEAAAYSIDQHNESGAWNVGLLQNSARPSGAFIFKQTLKPETRASVKKQLEEKYTGARNAGKPMVLEGDLDYKAFSFSPKDMEWIESKHTSARDIALAFGVPSLLLGIPGDATYSNWREARQAFWVETIIPLIDDLIGYHNLWLLPLFGLKDHCLGYNKDELDALTPSRDGLWTRVTQAQHLSVNEKRVATGYDERPEPEYDEVLVSSSMVPVSLSAEPEQSVSPTALADENGDDEEGEDVDDTDEDEKFWEHKVFNLRPGKDRKRTWVAAQRKRKAHERRFAGQLKAVFDREAKDVARVVDGLTPDAAIIAAKDIIDQNRAVFERIVKANLLDIGRSFGEATLRAAKSAGIPQRKDTAENIHFESFLKHWVETHTARRITAVSQTTKRKIVAAIMDSFLEEEGVVPMSKRIQDAYDGFSKSRAMLIARTETVAASNAATLGAAKATGVPNLEKEWISSNDDRSRDGEPETTDHRAMDGVRVGIDAKFEVPSHDGVDTMESPGDPEAPVDQIANCRCTVGFVSQGEN